jgi:hypothetical protein
MIQPHDFGDDFGDDDDCGALEDRFDLEDAIMSCWNTCDDLSLLLRNVLEDSPDEDDIANAVQGIEALHKLRCQRLFDVFSVLVESGMIR